MNGIVELFSWLGVFLAGIAVRVGIVLLIVAALVAPVALVFWFARLCRSATPFARGLRRIGHVLYKPGLRYAAGHTWLEREGERVKIGVDGVAQEILPWVIDVELPAPGTVLAEGEVAVVLSCGSTEARIAAPIAGKVVAVNAEARRDPSLVKDDGYGRGWLIAIEPADARWSTLPAGDVARRWMEGESRRLERFLEDRLGLGWLERRSGAAPTVLAGADWAALTRAFLNA